MNTEKIINEILRVLDVEEPGGLKAVELQKAIGIPDKKHKDYYKFYRVLPKIRGKEINYHKKLQVYYLNKHEVKMWEKYKLYDEDSKKTALNLDCGFVFIEKGVLSQKEGSLVHFYKPRCKLISIWNATNYLNSIIDIEDEHDLLYIAVKNNNDFPVDDKTITIDIGVSRFFHRPVLIKVDNCECSIKGIEISVRCKSMLPKKSAYILLSLHPSEDNVSFDSKDIEQEYRISEEEPSVRCWYKRVPVEVKGGKVTLNTSKGETISLDEEKIGTWHFS